MARKQNVAESIPSPRPRPRRISDELPVNTTTAARRRRPSSKAREVESPSEVRRRATSTRAKAAATGRARKKALIAKSTARAREDKRESPQDVETTAVAKNLKVDKNDTKSKGKSAYELEASTPGTRPSRKSSRGGANRLKPDSQQRRQTMRAVRSPKHRNAMRGG